MTILKNDFIVTNISLRGTNQFGEFCPVFNQVVAHVQHLRTTKTSHSDDLCNRETENVCVQNAILY